MNLTTEQLLTVICLTCFICLWLEKKLIIFSHISGVCLTILVAIFLGSIGLIPHEHPIYDFFMGPALPLAIALMVFGIRFRSFLTLPKRVILIFIFGALSSIVGGILAAVLSAKTLGENAPKIAAQLTASYIGGNENSAAIGHMLNIPTEMFTVTFAVDAVVTSFWMVFTILAARSTITETEVLKTGDRSFDQFPVSLIEIFMCFTLGILSIEISKLLSHYFSFMNPMLMLTLVALLMSRFSGIQALIRPAYLMGTILFVPFFFSIGAVSSIKEVVNLPFILILMPVIIVCVHGILIYSFGLLLKIPSSETSLASQALIGGAGTTVAFAQTKRWKSGISMGLILGLVGYAIANFLGMFVYHASTWIINFLGISNGT